MNKIGFNLLAWSAVVSEKSWPIVDRLKEIGYDGIECFIGSPEISDYQRLGQHVKSLDMELTCVFILGKEENLISPSSTVRAKGLDRIKWAIDRANDMDAKLICGPFHSAFATFAQHAPEEREYGWSSEILHAAGEYAAQADIILAIEAVNRYETYLCNTMGQLALLVNKADHPNIKAMFDTHHANIEEKKIKEAIHTIAPILAHVHISENDRGTPGEGHVPWEETFSTLAEINYKNWLVIEGFTRNDPDFANSINVWREYSKPWEMAEKGLRFIRQGCLQHSLD